MQVADEAAGQKTQCPNCKKVIVVPTKPPQGPVTTPQSPPPGGSKPPTDIRTPVPSRPSPPGPSPAIAPKESPAAAATALQVRCPHCQQLMRATPGATVNCPHCAATVKIPLPGGSSAASKATTKDLFEDLPPPTRAGAGYGLPTQPTGFGGPSFGAASAPRMPNPYSPQPNFGRPAAGYSSGGYANSGGNSKNWQYTLLGIIFIFFGAIMLLAVLVSVGTSIWTLAMGNGNADMATVAFIRLAGAFFVSLPISIVYLYGGFAFVNRSSLSAAKTVAVIAIIPCFNLCILMPFGIWAAILAFDGAAQRDFHN